MADDLKTKTAKGVGWGFADNILGLGITAAANIILARILSPADFGIIRYHRHDGYFHDIVYFFGGQWFYKRPYKKKRCCKGRL